MMPFILTWLKIKTNLIKLVLNTFISITGPIILQNCPILSPSEPDQLIQLSGNRGWPTSFQDSLRFGVNTELVNAFSRTSLIAA